MVRPRIFVRRGTEAAILKAIFARTKFRQHIKDTYVSPWRESVARPAQLAPEGIDWDAWIIRAGRGFGKTRSGAEWCHEQARAGLKRGALVGATVADVRDTMVEGESGIVETCPDDLLPIKYEPSKRRVTYGNGCRLYLYTSEKPRQLRGPQHEFAWADETCFWEHLEDTWDNLMLGLRKGPCPRVVVTTTPLPSKWLDELRKDPTTVETTGTTYDNIINLSEKFKERIVRKYEGTRLGKQELYGEILDDIPGALWTAVMIEAARLGGRIGTDFKIPDMEVMRVAVDPAVTSNASSAETGIIVGGRAPCGCKGHIENHAFIYADLSLKSTPNGWARRTVRGFDEYEADRVVAETNNGGDLVVNNIRTVSPHIPVKKVTASRGKYKRAEPTSALYEQGKVHHVGLLPELEDQLLHFTPDGTYELIDRADALVWLLTDLMLSPSKEMRAA